MGHARRLIPARVSASRNRYSLNIQQALACWMFVVQLPQIASFDPILYNLPKH
jgi:hypothetical protein